MSARHPVLLCALLLCGAGCKKKEEPPAAGAPAASAGLLSEAKEQLQRRDSSLSSYHLRTTVTEGANVASFSFWFRAPNKMKGVIEQPTQVTYAFDGKALQQLTAADKRLAVMKLDGASEKHALLLNRTFAPFAPEGYRAPLLVKLGVTARKVSHPKATLAVELSQQARDETGVAKVTYVFRWPSMDFLSKVSELGGNRSEVRVDDEHCDELLKLCVPKKLSQLVNGEVVGKSDITTIELNVPVPSDAFTVVLPEGYQQVEAP